MTRASIDSSNFIHGGEGEGPSRFLQIFTGPGDPANGVGEVSRLKAAGLDLNASVSEEVAKGPHDPRSAFTQLLSTGDSYALRGLAYLGARPAEGENIAAAFPLTSVRLGDELFEGHDDDRFLMARQVESEGLIRAMQAYGVDLAAPIEGAPAAHAWTRAAVEAEGFAHDDAHRWRKTTRFLTSLARAGVDFSEKDADGRDARALAADLVAKGAGLVHPEKATPEETAERARYFDGALGKAEAQGLSRDAAVKAAAERKSAATARKKPVRARADSSHEIG